MYICACMHINKVHLKLPSEAEHCTPASSLRKQSSFPHPLCVQSSTVDSVPTQVTLLSQVIPLPCP